MGSRYSVAGMPVRRAALRCRFLQERASRVGRQRAAKHNNEAGNVRVLL